MVVLSEKELYTINEVVALYKQAKNNSSNADDILTDVQNNYRAKSELIEYMMNLEDSYVRTIMAVCYIGINEVASDKSVEHILDEWRDRVLTDFEDKKARVDHISRKALDRNLTQGLSILNK